MSKAENLEIMKKNGIKIPDFIIVEEIEKIDVYIKSKIQRN